MTQTRNAAAVPDDEPRVEALLDLLVAGVTDYAILMLDTDGRIATWNAGAQRFKGYRPEEIIGQHFSVFYPPEDIAAGKPARVLVVAAAEGRLEDEGWRVRKDGSRFWANVVITALRDATGTLRGYGKVTRDLSERRAAELALRASEERFRLLVESVQDYAILMLDAQGNVATWNAGAQRFKGYTPAEIIGRHFSVFYPAEDIAAGKPERELVVAAADGRLEDEGWRIRKDGSRFWANVVITALRDTEGRLQGYGKVTRDLTERRNHERKLEHIADHDPLTGVLNRRSFARELNGHVARVARFGAKGGLLMIDLDNFKHFNDTQGHGGGDQLLVRIARGLESRLRESDQLARLGGDEFAVLLPDADEHAIETVAEALLQIVRDEPMPASMSKIARVSASIGIARFDDGERLTPEEMLSNADQAMYKAKKLGRDRWARYNPAESGDTEPERGPGRAQQISDAIAGDGFVLLAQPIVSLTRAGGPPHYELLLRMRDENGELLLPEAFLHVAERSGLIGHIDAWVVRSAIRMLAELRSWDHDVRFAVNLSGMSIGDARLLDLVESSLKASGVPPDRLIFEVTEAAAVAHMGRSIHFAERLAQLGCGFALDDFGAAFGSFYYIKHIPFDYVKIDGEFVQHCSESETDRILIGAIARIARSMGKLTIAKCASSEEEIETLTLLGVDYGQGSYFGEPAPIHAYVGASGVQPVIPSRFSSIPPAPRAVGAPANSS